MWPFRDASTVVNLTSFGRTFAKQDVSLAVRVLVWKSVDHCIPYTRSAIRQARVSDAGRGKEVNFTNYNHLTRTWAEIGTSAATLRLKRLTWPKERINRRHHALLTSIKQSVPVCYSMLEDLWRIFSPTSKRGSARSCLWAHTLTGSF